MRSLVWLAFFALVGWLILARVPSIVDPLNIQDTLARAAGDLRAPHTIGQTFTAHAPHLNALHVCWVLSDDFTFAPASRVTLHLRARVDAPNDLATATLSLEQIQREACSIFRFAPQTDSAERAYYFFLDASEADITRGWFSVWASADDVLPDGRAYADHTPTPYDLAFRAYTAPDGLGTLALVRDTLAAQPAHLLIVIWLTLLTSLAAQPPPITARAWLSQTTALFTLALGALALGIAQFAELPAPLWVDSYQHAADIQAILRGEPPLARVYHFGFHFIVAWVAQISGTSIPAAMILVGQWISVQIGLSFFAFGKRWTGSARVGIVSALCVWFLTPTPMYFLTWGRYPLLLGTAILPLALISAMNWLTAPRFDGRAFLCVIVTFLALAFAHLRLLAFYAVFVALYAAWQRAPARRLAFLALALAPLALGWVAAILHQPDGARNLGVALTFWSGIDLGTAFEILRSHYGWGVGIVAVLGFIRARQDARARFIVLWFSALLLLAALFTWVGAPLVEVPFVLLMAFYPAALGIGEWAASMFARKWLGALISVGVCLLGAREMLAIFNPTTILFTRADARAIEWLATNTPRDARIAINAFEWYPNIYVPADGGAWIPYWAERAVVVAQPNTRVETSAAYVYLGRRAGILRARDFADASRYALVYHAEGISIWKIQ